MNPDAVRDLARREEASRSIHATLRAFSSEIKISILLSHFSVDALVKAAADLSDAAKRAE